MGITDVLFSDVLRRLRLVVLVAALALCTVLDARAGDQHSTADPCEIQLVSRDNTHESFTIRAW